MVLNSPNKLVVKGRLNSISSLSNSEYLHQDLQCFSEVWIIKGHEVGTDRDEHSPDIESYFRGARTCILVLIESSIQEGKIHHYRLSFSSMICQ